MFPSESPSDRGPFSARSRGLFLARAHRLPHLKYSSTSVNSGQLRPMLCRGKCSGQCSKCLVRPRSPSTISLAAYTPGQQLDPAAGTEPNQFSTLDLRAKAGENKAFTAARRCDPTEPSGVNELPVLRFPRVRSATRGQWLTSGMGRRAESLKPTLRPPQEFSARRLTIALAATKLNVIATYTATTVLKRKGYE